MNRKYLEYCYMLGGLASFLVLGMIWGMTLQEEPSRFFGVYAVSVPFLLTGVYTVVRTIAEINGGNN